MPLPLRSYSIADHITLFSWPLSHPITKPHSMFFPHSLTYTKMVTKKRNRFQGSDYFENVWLLENENLKITQDLPTNERKIFICL